MTWLNPPELEEPTQDSPSKILPEVLSWEDGMNLLIKLYDGCWQIIQSVRWAIANTK
jgi:hypothetical protein